MRIRIIATTIVMLGIGVIARAQVPQSFSGKVSSKATVSADAGNQRSNAQGQSVPASSTAGRVNNRGATGTATMGEVYQSMSEMTQEGYEVKRQQRQEVQAVSETKLKVAQESTIAKEEEIEEKTDSAQGQFKAISPEKVQYNKKKWR